MIEIYITPSVPVEAGMWHIQSTPPCRDLRPSPNIVVHPLVWRSNLSHSKNPANLKPAELKKACATRGLSPMGYPDELLEALMGYLKKHGGSNGGRYFHISK